MPPRRSQTFQRGFRDGAFTITLPEFLCGSCHRALPRLDQVEWLSLESLHED